MRRRDREVTDLKELEIILQECMVVRLGLQDDEGIFVVPMNYGYCLEGEKLTLYLHSAQEGRKVAAFRQGETAAFEMDCCHALQTAETACAHSFGYRSLMGTGTLQELTSPGEKRTALEQIMAHMTGRTWEIPERALDSVAVFALCVKRWTGKQNQ